MSEWSLTITGDGSQQPPYKWSLKRRNDNKSYNGSGETRADCIAQSYSRAKLVMEEERAARTSEVVEFDVELGPPVPADEFERIPVVEPNRPKKRRIL